MAVIMENCSAKKVVAEKEAEEEDWVRVEGEGKKKLWMEGRSDGKGDLDVRRNLGEVRGYEKPFSTPMPVCMAEFGAHRATSV